MVVDEEQRFGVEHKQRLLSFRATADVLTLSATPIPRTLHMSLLGLRDISSLTTPPADRRAIVTEVLTMSSKRLQQAIQRELARGLSIPLSMMDVLTNTSHSWRMKRIMTCSSCSAGI